MLAERVGSTGSVLAVDLDTSLLEELASVDADYVTRSCPGGSLIARLLSLTVERLRERMALLGADTGEIDEARRLFEDPACTVTSPTSCVARGRRP
jgi:hypothetical protein